SSRDVDVPEQSSDFGATHQGRKTGIASRQSMPAVPSSDSQDPGIQTLGFDNISVNGAGLTDSLDHDRVSLDIQDDHQDNDDYQVIADNEEICDTHYDLDNNQDNYSSDEDDLSIGDLNSKT
ncbi:hypothetical protein DFQ28_003948, partial [Apophysomyces sp. BC1034]